MRTVWLASYPKSGNTWVRMMIGALAAPEADDLDINDLPQRDGIASGRGAFDYHTLVDSSLLTYDEIDRLRPVVHAAEANGLHDAGDDPRPLQSTTTRFVKTHDAYMRGPAGAPILGGRQAADGAVLIVRDPRDVAPSVASHSNVSLDEAIGRMCDTSFALCAEPDRGAIQLRQQLLGWSGFAESWLSQTDLPTIVLRYEDMQADPAAALARVMDFAGDSRPPEALARAASLTDFARLQRQEAETGFRERLPGAKGGFFRRGQAGGWKDELTPAQAAQIAAAHGPMMRRMGYEAAAASPTTAPPLSAHD
jgi:hypothetical protein